MTYIIDVDKVNQTENAYPSPLVNPDTKLPLGTQCAALVQGATPAAGSSNPPQQKYWRPGLWVHGTQPGTIRKGTVIATFLKNMYPLTDPRHTGLYISHDENGITIMDQWEGPTGRTPGIHRPLRFQGVANRGVDNGDLYYVVELTALPGQGGPCSAVEGSTGVNEQTLQ